MELPQLEVINQVLAVCRLAMDFEIPTHLLSKPFFSITKTDEELSIICEQNDVPEGAKVESNWRALRVKGELDFSLTGVLSSIATPLAEAKISIFALSTFNTDYILVKQESLKGACEALRNSGFKVLD